MSGRTPRSVSAAANDISLILGLSTGQEIIGQQSDAADYQNILCFHGCLRDHLSMVMGWRLRVTTMLPAVVAPPPLLVYFTVQSA